MESIFLFLSLVFLLTFALGWLIEKIRVPWIFASLLIGTAFAAANIFTNFTSSETFNFLAELGMYFLLFVIGFEIDANEFKKASKFIFESTFFIILIEALFGSAVVHFAFGYAWNVSFVVALSFATVGEAILIPILDESRIVNTKLGQSIIGIGVLDDLIEIAALILVIILIGTDSALGLNMGWVFVSLSALFVMTFGLRKLKKESMKFNFRKIEVLFLFTLFILFLFLGIGQYADATALAALLAGISLKTFVPPKRLKTIESEVKTMCYGFFAPLFFFWVGATMNIKYLFSYPLLVLLVVLVSGGAKILGSYIVGARKLGKKKSVLLGIGLSVRFSTSLIIVKILLDNGIINTGLYSVIVASSIVFAFAVPFVFSNLLARWR